ncbi:MAG: hypothetical protein IKS54_07065 [Erysipelotrichaceae bacterium]|nr:hypothetical protein [Erysipelotrichaceae bacterium]
MLGWVSYKTKAEREKDRKDFNDRIFPYGEKQKEKAEEILKQLIPSFDPEISVYQYLVCKDLLIRQKEEFSDEEKIHMITKALKFTMKKKNKADLCRMIALCEADLLVDESLNYPDIETIVKRVKKLEEI